MPTDVSMFSSGLARNRHQNHPAKQTSLTPRKKLKLRIRKTLLYVPHLTTTDQDVSRKDLTSSQSFKRVNTPFQPDWWYGRCCIQKTLQPVFV